MIGLGVAAGAAAPFLIFHRIVRWRKTFGNDGAIDRKLYYGSLK